MYVFTMDGSFDALLDMSLENAERYAMRRMSACGETPSYRSAYGVAPNHHTIQYGTDNEQKIPSARHSSSTLRAVEPKTLLVGERSWEGAEKEDRFHQWEKFIDEAREVTDDPHHGGDGSYYQWPWPIPSESE